MKKQLTGAEIRQSFIDYFVNRGHTFVQSASLVPGTDQTLLFTNAGMVQFKDVFLGLDSRPYKMAVNSQKCLRVAGKHNDLDDVGRDNTHQTLFEMLGNWSFGDYYKKEAIEYAWDLLTNVWGLDKSRLWVTVFRDDMNEIPEDAEAAEAWIKQPGLDSSHVLYFGRKDNFWEMAETGPCGPCSEIHYDLGIEHCDKQGAEGHVCAVNGDCKRFTELWNLVFIQYNRIDESTLENLPAKHVDTGMGLERIVGVIQEVYSNYMTDLLLPAIRKVQEITGDSDAERNANLTPYRVIADHTRAASFLIADGVTPGNTGRNYVCRMIIRRASLFGRKLGLHKPFIAEVAEVVINDYQHAYPELGKNKKAIIDNLTREEIRFQKTVDVALNVLEDILINMKANGEILLDGRTGFDLYATHGLPLEITKDIVSEYGIKVDDQAFKLALNEHRLISGSGTAMGKMGNQDVELYRDVINQLIASKRVDGNGVIHNPYQAETIESTIIGILRDGERVDSALNGDEVEVILPVTNFYMESGGQVSDIGIISSVNSENWQIRISEVDRPAAGLIIHRGQVVNGVIRVGDQAIVQVDIDHRNNVRRNHTATHLLHEELKRILGEHARQAGSLVASDRLRFDFTHPESVTAAQLHQIEEGVNNVIYKGYPVKIEEKNLQEALADGATALFGEKYHEVVRTVALGDDSFSSYELCGGTHVKNTGDIGLFIITSEGSVASGIRRIEAITGINAYLYMKEKIAILNKVAKQLNSPAETLPERISVLEQDLDDSRKQVVELKEKQLRTEFLEKLSNVNYINQVPYISVNIQNANADNLRQLADLFKQKHSSGVVVVGSVYEGNPVLVAAVSEDLVNKGVHAGDLVKTIAKEVDGGGGGKPTLAQAGGKNPSGLDNALNLVEMYLKSKLE